MWDIVRTYTVRPDHGVYIPKRGRPRWIRAGPAFLAPLRNKRPLLVDEANWLHAWTLFTDAIDTSGWEKSPDEYPQYVLKVEIHPRKPSGWYFIPPARLRELKWFPSAGESVICEFGNDEELNYWTEAAYNIEAYRESVA